jgi:general secretion pathway protein D
VLTFAENRIFFTCNQNSAASTTTGTGSTTTTGAAFQCSQGSVPIGILMSILPTVDLETNEVTLNVRPTLSRQVGTKADPGTAISIASAVGTATGAAATALAAIDNAIPVVEVRELDSIMKVKNGGVMVIGGLLEEVNTSNEGGVPVLSEVPWVGNAFKSRNDDTQKRELIIFIKATIVDSSGNFAPADKSVYEKFTTDPRPLNL